MTHMNAKTDTVVIELAGVEVSHVDAPEVVVVVPGPSTHAPHKSVHPPQLQILGRQKSSVRVKQVCVPAPPSQELG